MRSLVGEHVSQPFVSQRSLGRTSDSQRDSLFCRIQLDTHGHVRTKNPEICGVSGYYSDKYGQRWTINWWAHQDSNLEPKDYESSALTIEL